MSIFSDFINEENQLKNKFRKIKPMESWSGIYPKGDKRWMTGGLDPMPKGLINKISRVPIKLK